MGRTASCLMVIGLVMMMFTGCESARTTGSNPVTSATPSSKTPLSVVPNPPPTQLPPTLVPSPIPSAPVIVFIPTRITKEKDPYKAGWATLTINFVAENQGTKPFWGDWPRKGILKVKEGFEYAVTVGGVRPDGLFDTENYNFSSEAIIPPGFRILMPPYVTEIAETTTPSTIEFEMFGKFSVEKLVNTTTFPTDLARSSFNQIPDTIESPGIARITVKGSSPVKSVNFDNGFYGDVRSESAFMGVTFENLSIGKDQKMEPFIAFIDGNGIAKRWDGMVLNPERNRCAGSDETFFAGPKQTHESQLCIRLGKNEPFPALSINNLKVLLWISDGVWRIYDVGL